ncbi:hypothetical protein J7426_19880 [Tropicibacter sp. R16_0]|uniref:hypothetical protein n=1 Tax=Tropicibacter sp. R16_0 TaxID=2821102 RepID=UPI001ADB0124|nr:hypothetical protein [Tropicibacter sp. R16_0]MBO9452541.1 hypothetical protein [Tropicibacter sp. R16_0]
MTSNIQVDEEKFNGDKQETAYPMTCLSRRTHGHQVSAGMMLQLKVFKPVGPFKREYCDFGLSFPSHSVHQSGDGLAGHPVFGHVLAISWNLAAYWETGVAI